MDRQIEGSYARKQMCVETHVYPGVCPCPVLLACRSQVFTFFRNSTTFSYLLCPEVFNIYCLHPSDIICDGLPLSISSHIW